MDRGRAACLDRLRDWSRHNRHPILSTIFICGIFYECFARGGLGSLDIGVSSNCYYPGSYRMNIENQTWEVVETTISGNQISVAISSIYDVAIFIVAALDLGIDNWPGDFTMQGDRRTVAEIISYAESVKGGTLFATDIIQARDLNTHLDYANYHQDYSKEHASQNSSLRWSDATIYPAKSQCCHQCRADLFQDLATNQLGLLTLSNLLSRLHNFVLGGLDSSIKQTHQIFTRL
ncbi:uncharacterized protein RAG0_16518 [Rhynchosporium agropyri]|uniref:NmrA-like domain-containing protein n=1 Tax=Rhynchosporium agropyri TaxID=914238 RepID=A0A1E1LQS3_9HELO|nr:uncharacterized protein RAG0_16518 [Rhynchosporium agropyri]